MWWDSTVGRATTFGSEHLILEISQTVKSVTEVCICGQPSYTYLRSVNDFNVTIVIDFFKCGPSYNKGSNFSVTYITLRHMGVVYSCWCLHISCQGCDLKVWFLKIKGKPKVYITVTSVNAMLKSYTSLFTVPSHLLHFRWSRKRKTFQMQHLSRRH